MNPDKDSNGKYRYKWYCLSIRKAVSGKKLQVLTRIPYDDSGNYQIWCKGDDSIYLDLINLACKGSSEWGSKIPDPDNPGKEKRTHNLPDRGFTKGCANFK